MTRIYWFTLHCVAEPHLSLLHREKHIKNLWQCFSSFLLLPHTFRLTSSVMSVDADLCEFCYERLMPWRTRDVWREYEYDTMDCERDVHPQLCNTSWPCVFADLVLLREALQRTLGIRDRLGCSCRLLAIHMRPAGFYQVIPPLLICACYPNTTELYCCCICEVILSGSNCHY